MRNNKTQDITLIAIMAAIMCILAPLAIPLPGGVPISLTNFVIYLAVYIIGEKGVVSFVIYLMIGMMGIPVFSNFTGGVGKLLGPTGGYIVGFLPMAVICAVVLKWFKGKMLPYTIAMVIGLLVAYTLGSGWFMYSCQMSLIDTLKVCVLPFLLADAIKIAIVVVVGPKVKKRIYNR